MDKFADRYKTKPEFDTSGAQFSPTPSNGAGFQAPSRQNPKPDEPEPNRGYDGSLMDNRESDHGYGDA